MTQPTAHEVAIELRKLADSLDREPDAIIPQAWISFYADAKEPFLNAARLMPRPAIKRMANEGTSYVRVNLEHKTKAAWVTVSVPQSMTCELVEPAKPAVYRCDPILSQIEEETLEVQA